VKVFLVDDSTPARLTLGALLEDAGHEVIEADSLASARARLATAAPFDVALLDVRLGDGLGPELIPELRARLPKVLVVLLTGNATDVATGGADAVFEKAGDPEALIARLEALRAGRS
jgi:two-component system response regulator PilR (NtrC family)